MSKIKNPTLLSAAYGIDPSKLNKIGIFNPLVNVDTSLFIDPLLLKYSKFDEFNKDAVLVYKRHFEKIVKLLEASKSEGDLAWRSAIRLLPRKEIDGTCLGYGINSISGRSLSTEIQKRILRSGKEIISLGIEDPELFMLLPLFEEGIGPDTISDLTTMMIEDVLLSFTSKIATQVGLPLKKVFYKGKESMLLINPLRKVTSPVLLLPQDILRDLPIVTSWDDIAAASSFNIDVRNAVNKMIADIWKAKTKKDKDKKKKELFSNKRALETLLSVIKNGKISAYDFEKDNLSLLAWHQILETVNSKYPVLLSKKQSTESDLKTIVKTIIDQFQHLVEEKGLNKLLWKETGKPNNERSIQLLFYATAYSYCKANDTDINPEMDTGIGYVDFKFSKGFSKRIIVETKCSYNPKIIEGFSTQLEAYKKSEETCMGFYVIVDVGRIGKKYDKLLKLYNDDAEKKSEIVYINGNIKPSASKRKE